MGGLLRADLHADAVVDQQKAVADILDLIDVGDHHSDLIPCLTLNSVMP